MLIDNTLMRIDRFQDGIGLLMYPLTTFGFNVIINESNFSQLENMSKSTTSTIVKPLLKQMNAINVQLYYAMSSLIKRTEEFSSDIFSFKPLRGNGHKYLIDFRDGSGMTLQEMIDMNNKTSSGGYKLKAIQSFIIFQRLYTFNQQLMISRGIGEESNHLRDGFENLFNHIRLEFTRESQTCSAEALERANWNGYIENVQDQPSYVVMLWYLVTHNFSQLVPYLSESHFENIIDFLIVQRSVTNDRRSNGSDGNQQGIVTAHNMSNITLDFWNDSNVFEFDSIVGLFQSALINRLLENVPDQQLIESLKKGDFEKTCDDVGVPTAYVRLLCLFPRHYFDPLFYSWLTQLLLWFARICKDDQQDLFVVYEQLNKIVNGQELQAEQASKIFEPSLIESCHDAKCFVRYVLRSKLDSCRTKVQRSTMVDYCKQMLNHEQISSSVCRVLCDKFDDTIPQKFSDRFDVLTMDIKVKNISAVLSMMTLEDCATLRDESMHILLSLQCAFGHLASKSHSSIELNLQESSNRVLNALRKNQVDQDYLSRIVDAITLFGWNNLVSPWTPPFEIFSLLFNHLLQNETLMARFALRCDPPQQITLFKLITQRIMHPQDSKQALVSLRSCQVFLENCDMHLIINTHHSNVFSGVSYLLSNNSDLKIGVTAGRLCIAVVDMVSHKCCNASKSNLINIVVSLVDNCINNSQSDLLNGCELFDTVCDLLDHMFRLNIFSMAFAPVLVQVLNKLVSLLCRTMSVGVLDGDVGTDRVSNMVVSISKVYERLSRSKSLNPFYEQIIYDFVHVVGQHQFEVNSNRRVSEQEKKVVDFKRQGLKNLCGKGFSDLLLHCSGKAKTSIGTRFSKNYFHKQLFIEMCSAASDQGVDVQ
ncbi:hypothetical protein AKO1_008904 [Acrasis kona]|uniref:Uncharacterized protein n=2 Tax=Acrasis kona TaxID=1008807 RepID=A0AAW2ZGC8_9EUKA